MMIVAKKATTPINTAMMRMRTWTQLTLGAARTCNLIGQYIKGRVLIGPYLRAPLHASHGELVEHGPESLVAGLVQQLVHLVQVDNVLVVQNLQTWEHGSYTVSTDGFLFAQTWKHELVRPKSRLPSTLL